MRHPVLLAMAALLALSAASVGHTAGNPAVHVSKAWIRVMPGMLPNAGYGVLHNDSDKPVALVSASSPDYGHVMLHQSTETGGVSRMHMVDKLTIPAHGEVTLAPGGYHLMLMHRQATVKPGMQVEITLHFADGSTLKQAFLARPANASGFSD